ncbi:hypothetical protein GS397_01825 [Sphingobium yanoikuyae]|jgi:hypothetical protein|uniref:C-type lysozyme inhibitor domain-containing protein n=1 Tax=Sphingobium yanoikuyae TaxID=13690 RepID=A0A6P1GDZ3_SPHYA|nr:hypothetical protein [Sphingobium yanoikuyae]QHD65931.1 hypothetical protein GS397_01825 [Sphingobium yanoikuyae]
MCRWTVQSLATALALIFSLPLSASAETNAQVRIHCENGRYFLLGFAPRRATVIAEKRRYEMRRKESSLGQYYHSTEATLIIDGDFVAFVPRDDWDWQGCRIDRPPEPSAKD